MESRFLPWGPLRGLTRALGLALILALLALAPATASAAPAISGEFPAVGTLSGGPKHLSQGPDGNIWVVLEGAKLAKITPDGAVTEYATSNLSTPIGITAGPDGNLWVTGTNQVVKVSPSDPTVGVPTTINEIGGAQAITTGPDNNLWTASQTSLIKIPPGNPSGYTHFDAVLGGARGIARGNDDQLWVADFGGQRIASFTTAGAPTYYGTDATGGPMQVAAGPGTQIGFTDPIVQPEEIGRITPGGTAQRSMVSGGSGDPTGIAFGNDGAYWIARFGGNDLVRFTPDGQQTTLTGFSANAGPRQITNGPGDTLWVGLETAAKVARVTGVAAPPPGGGGAPGGGGGPLGFGAKTLVTLRLAARRIPARGPLKILVANNNGFAITGKLSGKTTGKVSVSKRKRVKLKAKRFSVGAHAKKTVKLKLPKTLRRRLVRKHKLSLRLTVKVKDPAGHTRTVGKTVRPKLKRKRSR
jgi:streptogramin lyase